MALSLVPQPAVTEEELRLGLRRLVHEAAYSSATMALTSGVILTALALHLGASNLMVGLLASAPFLGQLLQAPAVLLVERLRRRKAISVWSSVIGRSMLVLMALAALLPPDIALALVAFAQFLLCGMQAFGACAWNSWMRDLAPAERLGWVFSRRTAWTTAISLVAGLAAALLLDRTADGSAVRSWAFAGLYLVGCAAGLVSAFVVAKLPEPAMPPRPSEGLGLVALFREPFADRNFRRLIHFLSAWQFAVNLATPFFTVYIVRQLGFSMTFVMVLSVVSQIANLIAIRSWGSLSDRFAHKSVLAVAAPTYVLAILAMIGASQLGGGQAAAIYLVLLHLLMGAAVAGVTLATTNIALKLSPRGSATAYVATSALASSAAAGLAPILGGLFADFFAHRRFELLMRWTSPEGVVLLSPLRLSNWDFYFLLAGVLGIYALHRLSLVHEEGHIERRLMVQELFGETRRAVRNLGTVAGLRAITDLPGTFLREARVRARYHRRQRALAGGIGS